MTHITEIKRTQTQHTENIEVIADILMDDALFHQDQQLYEQINNEIIESVNKEKLEKKNPKAFEFKLEKIDSVETNLLRQAEAKSKKSKEIETNNSDQVTFEKDKDISQTRITDRGSDETASIMESEMSEESAGSEE